MILMEHADWHKPGEPAQTIVSPLWRPNGLSLCFAA
jgi:hypothetical protein